MIVDIPLRRLLRLADPLATPPWRTWPRVSRAAVEQALALPLLDPRASQPLTERAAASGVLHAQRIAWLVQHPWNDPIAFDATLADRNWWPITDGNHRLAAATVLGWNTIPGTVDGFESSIQTHLGRAVAQAVFQD
jgi:hypothetical protein